MTAKEYRYCIHLQCDQHTRQSVTFYWARSREEAMKKAMRDFPVLKAERCVGPDGKEISRDIPGNVYRL